MYHLNNPYGQNNRCDYCLPYNYRNNTQRKQNENYTIRVEGSGSVTAKPDQAIISLGVIIEDENLQNAQQKNAFISNKIINALKRIGIQEDDIQTDSYTINPMYDFPDGKKVFRGYEVQHMFKITVDDISKVGLVVDTATQNGANNINNIEFSVSNADIYYKDALQNATLNTIKKAEAIAKTLKVNLNKTPLQVIERATNINQNIVGMPKLALASTMTPIQEGQIKIVSFVTAIFQYNFS